VIEFRCDDPAVLDERNGNAHGHRSGTLNPLDLTGDSNRSDNRRDRPTTAWRRTGAVNFAVQRGDLIRRD
jgi:hypothetical protein